MTVTVHITVKDEAVMAALRDPQLIAGPLKDFFAESTLAIEGRAIELAPIGVSGGAGLKGSITSVLEPTRALVQSNVFYAPFVELGTRPHWPPPDALERWVYLKIQQGSVRARKRSANARAAGMMSTKTLAFLIARSISRRGTRPHPFMRPAAEQSLPAIRGFLREMAQAIEARWQRGS